jgi:hypothetical protein
MRLLHVIIFVFATLLAGAQTKNDVLLVKKGNKTVRQYYQGNSLSFRTTEGYPVQGFIDSLKRDSLFLTYYQTRMKPTFAGTFTLDTTGRFRDTYHVSNIGYLPSLQKGRNILTDGTVLMIGGAVYLGVNAVNTAREKEPWLGENNLPRVLTGLAVIVAGWLAHRTWERHEELRIGKKFKLVVL